MPAATRRVAVVTGGNRGIGREIVRQLAGRGLTVVLGARDPAEASRVAEELGGVDAGVLAHQLDVADASSVERLGAWVARELGRADVLVNNAGAYWAFHSASAADVEMVRGALDTNLLGAWRMSVALVPLMRR
ncbi:MAG: SDR family NAD(P)-dependent oxidoreductase [Candidatus Dormibacteria bacterium]